MTNLRTAWPGFRVSATERNSFVPPKRPFWLCGLPSLLIYRHRGSFPGIEQSGLKFTTLLRQLPKLSMSGAKLPLLYALMVWIGTNLLRHVPSELYDALYFVVQEKFTNFTFIWPCIVTNFFIIKPTRCTSFPNLLRHKTLHVSDSSSAHYQEFVNCTLGTDICHTVCR